MGFFKDLKEDLSQAVNELSDDASKFAGDEPVPADDDMVDTLADDGTEDTSSSELEASLTKAIENMNISSEAVENDGDIKEKTAQSARTSNNTAKQGRSKAAQNASDSQSTQDGREEQEDAVSDEKAIITPGLSIKGDVTSNGSIELLGMVEGNVTCKGKLIVSGTIKGNTSSSDFFSDKANITGDVNCTGPAKIGTGSVIIGNLVASSAVIAGAIKGDIDVQGPVIVDTTAIVMGNIKSKLVQINNGAVIEGFCSQCYSDNSPKKFFGED